MNAVENIRGIVTGYWSGRRCLGMRWAVALVVCASLAGCSGGSSLLSLGNCSLEEFNEDDFTGAFQECTDVAGAGSFVWRADCDQGLLGVERDGGNGTLTVTFTTSEGSQQHNLTSEDEAFLDFHERGARMHLRTSADFTTPELSFGVLCFPEEFA